MFNYFKECVTTNYADFNGRARRSEFWYFHLFNTIFSYAISLPLAYLAVSTGTMELTYIGMIYSLAVIIPSIAVLIRRMHDVGKSGWYSLIPFYNLYLCFIEGEPGENEYGPNPKGIGNGASNDELINSIGNN
jgi:uncharacterized membrane protein YhaH (DUF805 family)